MIFRLLITTIISLTQQEIEAKNNALNQCECYISITCEKCKNFILHTYNHIQQKYNIDFDVKIRFFDAIGLQTAILLSKVDDKHKKIALLQEIFKKQEKGTISKGSILDALDTFGIKHDEKQENVIKRSEIEKNEIYKKKGVEITPYFRINNNVFFDDDSLIKYIKSNIPTKI